MNRRKFIKQGGILLPGIFSGFKLHAAGPWLEPALRQIVRPETNDRVQVMIQLFGGNDGLNTIVPLESYSNYVSARKKLALGERKLILPGRNAGFGFHPSLQGLNELFNHGKLSVIHSVGYPSQDFSHFRSSDIWLSGSAADEALTTGWAGRYLGMHHPDYPDHYPGETHPHPLAIQVGDATSFLFQGPHAPMAINVADTDHVYQLSGGFETERLSAKPMDALDFVKDIAEQSQSYSKIIKQLSGTVTKQYDYPPNNPLGDQLRIVARMIKGGAKTKLYLVTYDGFDTHAQQVDAGDSSKGRHADLLKIVSDAMFAFQADLDFLNIADRVSGFTFSEFGRRIHANDSLGTDHGAAAPMFLFGPNLKASTFGSVPVIEEDLQTGANIPMQVDFRSVYTGVLRGWLGIDDAELERLFPGAGIDQVFFR